MNTHYVVGVCSGWCLSGRFNSSPNNNVSRVCACGTESKSKFVDAIPHQH